MKNKVLIKVYSIEFDETFELYIPTNETIKTILEAVLKLIIDSSEYELNDTNQKMLIDPENITPYLESRLIRDTNIRNSKLLILI